MRVVKVKASFVACFKVFNFEAKRFLMSLSLYKSLKQRLTL